MHGKPTAPGNTVRVVGTLGLLMHEVKKKKDLRPSEQLSIGSGLAGWCQICDHRTGRRKRRVEFLKDAAQFGLFLLFVFVNGGFPSS